MTPEQIVEIAKKADQYWQRGVLSTERSLSYKGRNRGCEQYIWVGAGEKPLLIDDGNKYDFLCAGDFVPIIGFALNVMVYPIFLERLKTMGGGGEDGMKLTIEKLLDLIEILGDLFGPLPDEIEDGANDGS